MKKTLEERIRSRLLKWGKKNRICRMLVIPVLIFSTVVFHVISCLKDNEKKLSMLAMSFFLFTIFSSFTFPLFIERNQNMTDNKFLQASSDIVFAVEANVDINEVILMEEEEEEEEDLSFNINKSIDENTGLTEENDSGTMDENTANKKYTQYHFLADDWRILLINKQHSIPEDYSFNLGTIDTIKGTMYCDERIIEEYHRMKEDAKKEEIYIDICSPYRDYEYQTKLFNRKINRYINRGMSFLEAYRVSSQVVTVPGASEHQIGLAFDIISNTYDSLDEGFGNTDAGIWLAQNSYKYGFILRYPKGKEYITGIEYEPWHFRYVGKEAAEVITLEEITLEEFWEEYL